MKQYKVLIALILIISTVSVFSQDSGISDSDDLENLDDLFSNPEDDLIVEEPEIDNRTQFEISEKIKFSGSFNSTAVVGAGWTKWNFFNDVKDGFDASAGIEANFNLNIDVRPAPQARIFGSLYTAFDPYELLENSDPSLEAIWTMPYFREIYCDYILADTLYTKIGKFSIGWGQGRFYTPGNLVSESSDSSLNIKMSLPNLMGLSFVLLTNNSINYKDFTYGGKVDFVFGETMVSPGVKYSRDGLHTVLSLKQVLFKTDFLIDFTTNINSSLLQSTYIVAGFYHDWTSFTLYGEYQYYWLRDESKHDHEASLAALWKKPFGAPFDLGLQFMQNFVDGSGNVTLGLAQVIAPFLEMNIAVPIVYGDEGTSAVINNADPSGRRIALAIALKLSAGF